MNFHIMTLFPEMVKDGLNTSILGRAAKAGLINFECHDIRAYTNEKHGHVDDAPYGGGAGMIMQCQPIYDCYQDILKKTGKEKIKVIYTSPAGKTFNQEMAKDFAKEEDLVILCGHYEGVDARVLELLEAKEVSIGDYVLTGGELPAMVMVDAISRMVPGVLTNDESGQDESFSDVSPKDEFTKRTRAAVYGDLASKENIKLLEYPQYTRPEEFMGLKVPGVLLSGDHSKVEQWRRSKSLEKTKELRPDLLENDK